jgi:hypothetical protein
VPPGGCHWVALTGRTCLVRDERPLEGELSFSQQDEGLVIDVYWTRDRYWRRGRVSRVFFTAEREGEILDAAFQDEGGAEKAAPSMADTLERVTVEAAADGETLSESEAQLRADEYLERLEAERRQWHRQRISRLRVSIEYEDGRPFSHSKQDLCTTRYRLYAPSEPSVPSHPTVDGAPRQGGPHATGQGIGGEGYGGEGYGDGEGKHEEQAGDRDVGTPCKMRPMQVGNVTLADGTVIEDPHPVAPDAEQRRFFDPGALELFPSRFARRPSNHDMVRHADAVRLRTRWSIFLFDMVNAAGALGALQAVVDRLLEGARAAGSSASSSSPSPSPPRALPLSVCMVALSIAEHVSGFARAPTATGLVNALRTRVGHDELVLHCILRARGDDLRAISADNLERILDVARILISPIDLNISKSMHNLH